MAKYKLITQAEFEDNTVPESAEDVQRYIDTIKDDYLDSWDKVEVICSVDGEEYTSVGEGNRHNENGGDRTTKWPWQQLKDALPPDGLHVLIYDGCDLHMGWVKTKDAVGQANPDNRYQVFLEDYDGEDSFYDLSNVADWWWRKVEVPKALTNKEESC